MVVLTSQEPGRYRRGRLGLIVLTGVPKTPDGSVLGPFKYSPLTRITTTEVLPLSKT